MLIADISKAKLYMRSLASFMMWNHILIANSAYRCVRAGYKTMGYLGYLTTVLSLLSHRHNERDFAVPECICANSSLLLLVYHGLAAGLRPADAILPSATVFALWRLSQRDYERWHPWMHIVVAADVHYFLYCIKHRRPAT